MAPAATPTISSSEPPKLHASDIGSIKAFAESNGDSPIPSSYYSIVEARDDVADDLASSFPVIDFSLLTSDDPQLHAHAVTQLGNACAEWGFFMLTNHGISENLMEEVMSKSHEFHNLPTEEKKEFADKGPLAPIRHGTSFYPEAELFHYWRDYLKVITLPEFNFPHKPPGFKEVAYDYSRKIRAVARTLLKGISESLGLEPMAIVESTGFDSGLQIFAVNLYPPCPQPDLALGMPPHTDHGLLTLLYQNGIGGLQVKHDGKWVNVNPLPNCLIVNTADQLEAVSNGRYKSIWHRAVLNNKDTRLSIVLANGPELEKEIAPAAELVEREEATMYKKMKYRDYFSKVQQLTGLVNTSRLDKVGINPQN
ncbi:flavanone 3-dioxygenase 2-like [Neltuma alba]|uniref:flavanone 3-dioxygenase 2-like n=1 Tax=Neltuma alba TaxID=207710 RepID=UPI0010A33330|nr:flavanone 3-dioxygenase 2-like [Prosopis alba]XP_028806770.1 flavanone 3-dioxygenase 2-like [Prosopis alba]